MQHFFLTVSLFLFAHLLVDAYALIIVHMENVMPKFLTDDEIGTVVQKAIKNRSNFNPLLYKTFLELIAEAVGSLTCTEIASVEMDDGSWLVGLRATEDTAADGGLLADFDTDKPVAEWISESGVPPV